MVSAASHIGCLIASLLDCLQLNQIFDKNLQIYLKKKNNQKVNNFIKKMPTKQQNRERVKPGQWMKLNEWLNKFRNIKSDWLTLGDRQIEWVNEWLSSGIYIGLLDAILKWRRLLNECERATKLFLLSPNSSSILNHLQAFI